MRRCLTILLLVFAGQSLHAQTRVFEDQLWDFGDVNFWNNDTAWFTVRNGTEKNLIFLPTYYNEDFQVIFSNRAADPGESIQIGIIYYTEVKGKFNTTVPLYINQRGEPVNFRLKGNIKGFNPMAQLRCPVVNGGVEENPVNKVVTIEVRDIATDELLMPDEIGVKSRFNQNVRLERNKLEFEMVVAPGSYKVISRKKGYEDYEAVIILEPYQLNFIVYMEKGESEEVPPPLVDNPDPINTNRNPEEDDEPVVVVTTGDVHFHRVDTLPSTDPHVLHSHELSAEDYKLNNVILIVDVSSSMNRGGKVEALKSSFNVLIDALRANDQVGVISMSSNAELVQEPSNVKDKDSLKAKVAQMKAIGGTNGGAAIQLAYQQAREHFIPGGNNQIIVATDGVFYGGTLSRRQIEDMILAGNEEGIHLSAVAFGSDPKAMLFLGNLAEKGGGTIIQVQNSEESNSLLLDMIKSQSLRK